MTRAFLTLLIVSAIALVAVAVLSRGRRADPRSQREAPDWGDLSMSGSLRWVGVVVLIALIAVVSGQSLGGPLIEAP